MSQPDARFRHDLLTPVNHILGFATLLIDDAERRGPRDRLGELRRLLDEGWHIVAAIDEALPRDPAPGHRPDYARLADRLAIPDAAIGLACDRLAAGPDDSAPPDRAAFLDDLAKVREASALLVAMARQGPAGLPAA